MRVGKSESFVDAMTELYGAETAASAAGAVVAE